MSNQQQPAQHREPRQRRTLALMTTVLILAGFIAQEAQAARTFQFRFGDESIVLTIYQNGETARFPKRGGGWGTTTCRWWFLCWLTYRDHKTGVIGGIEIWEANQKNDTGIPLPQNLTATGGQVTYDSGSFEITASEGWDGLFRNTTVDAQFLGSSNFSAQIGDPGDQLPQGGSISFRTEWYSDQAIGIDPQTGEEIFLGHFFLDTGGPLSEFVITEEEIRFTATEIYTFDDGSQMVGTVTTAGTQVPQN